MLLAAGRLQAPPGKFPPVWMGFVSQGLEALSGPRSSSITRRAAGFPMLFLCIVSGENPAQARPLLTRCIQMLLDLATVALPQDWDQTLDLPQVTAVHTDPFAVKANLGMGWSTQSPSKGSVCIGYCSMRLLVPGAELCTLSSGVCPARAADIGAWCRAGHCAAAICHTNGGPDTAGTELTMLGHEECGHPALQ